MHVFDNPIVRDDGFVKQILEKQKWYVCDEFLFFFISIILKETRTAHIVLYEHVCCSWRNLESQLAFEYRRLDMVGPLVTRCVTLSS